MSACEFHQIGSNLSWGLHLVVKKIWEWINRCSVTLCQSGQVLHTSKLTCCSRVCSHVDDQLVDLPNFLPQTSQRYSYCSYMCYYVWTKFLTELFASAFTKVWLLISRVCSHMFDKSALVALKAVSYFVALNTLLLILWNSCQRYLGWQVSSLAVLHQTSLKIWFCVFSWVRSSLLNG